MLDYVDETAIEKVARDTVYPRNRNVNGYGSKIPTSYRVKLAGRWRRVYAICYSNAATLYVVVNGKPQYLNDYVLDGATL